MTVQQSPDGDVEGAIGWVRAILAAFATVVIISVGALRAVNIDGLMLPVASSVAIVAAAMGLAAAQRRIGPMKSLGVWVLQAGEISWYVALAAALASVIPKVAWVIMVIPIVTASLRLSERAVMATWLASGLAYVALTRPGVVSIDGEGQDVLERLAMLLAIAGATAVLTRWLKEGWQTQAALTREAERRNDRLSTIEEAARQMQDADPTEILDLCVSAVVGLGFDAATAGQQASGAVNLSDGPAFRAAGDGSVIPVDALVSLPAEHTVEIAIWQRPAGDSVHSAMTQAGGEDMVFVGWSRRPIGESLATSLSDLVATSMAALIASRHYERARYEATHDPLTGLINRSELDEQLKIATAEAGQLAVMFVDLDYFKPVNDTHGHQVGDALLAEIADRLRSTAGDYASIARYGGDEFVLVVPDLVRDKAVGLADQVRQALNTPFHIAGIELRISGSIGLLSTPDSIHPTTAIRLADEASYQAKAGGRDRVHLVRSEVLKQTPA